LGTSTWLLSNRADPFLNLVSLSFACSSRTSFKQPVSSFRLAGLIWASCKRALHAGFRLLWCVESPFSTPKTHLWHSSHLVMLPQRSGKPRTLYMLHLTDEIIRNAVIAVHTFLIVVLGLRMSALSIMIVVVLGWYSNLPRSRTPAKVFTRSIPILMNVIGSVVIAHTQPTKPYYNVASEWCCESREATVWTCC
jgi:hypothetical protein